MKKYMAFFALLCVLLPFVTPEKSYDTELCTALCFDVKDGEYKAVAFTEKAKISARGKTLSEAYGELNKKNIYFGSAEVYIFGKDTVPEMLCEVFVKDEKIRLSAPVYYAENGERIYEEYGEKILKLNKKSRLSFEIENAVSGSNHESYEIYEEGGELKCRQK